MHKNCIVQSMPSEHKLNTRLKQKGVEIIAKLMWSTEYCEDYCKNFAFECNETHTCIHMQKSMIIKSQVEKSPWIYLCYEGEPYFKNQHP